MDRNKFDIVLDLYKKDQITKDEAYTLLQETIIERVQPITIEPYQPYREPWSPYGPIVTYGVGTGNPPQSQQYQTISGTQESIQSQKIIKEQ